MLEFKIHKKKINIFRSFYTLPLIIFIILTLTFSNVKANNEGSRIPENFELYQNYPNPFNPSTRISYSISKEGFVKLTIYNMLGNEIAILVNEEQKAGTYSINFDASNLPSGVYFYRLQADNFTQTKKLTVLK